jgi:hypothetical protein
MYRRKVSRSQGRGARPASRALVLALSLAGFVGSCGLGFSASDNQESRGGLVRFDIPSQTLASALEAYARISGREVLYDGALAVGLHSDAIKGAYAPAEALRLLLAGTGLSAHFEDADFFVLTPTGSTDSAANAVSAAQQRYYGRLQANLRNAFCQKSEIFPGQYRVAARLWIGPSGDVVQEKRLASTGDTNLDREVDDALREIKLGSPPAGLEQPITIVIMPNAPGVRQDCQNSGTALAPVKARP